MMMRYAALLAPLALAACGAAELKPASALALADGPAPAGQAAELATGPALLIYVDGKDSCRRLPSLDDVAAGSFGAWASPFGTAVKAAGAADSAPVDYLVACLPFLGQPGRVTYDAVSPTQATAVTDTVDPDDFEAVLVQKIKAATGPVYLAGHSYGGWLAMQALLKLPAGVQIHKLMTVDAISPVTCTPLRGIGDYLRYGVVAGCNQAPTDITADQRQAIKGHAVIWTNRYETANAYLHSSPIAEATTNAQTAFAPVGVLAGLASENNPHLWVATDPATWTAFLAP